MHKTSRLVLVRSFSAALPNNHRMKLVVSSLLPVFVTPAMIRIFPKNE